MDDYDRSLLESLREGPKVLHMGSSPVSAIDRGFRLINDGYLHMDHDGWVSLTQKGREIIDSPRPR